jgi:hypothetical protein
LVTQPEQERRARENLLRLVAARPDSALADFAKDVLAGRREFRELAYTSVGAEEVMRDVQPALDAWARTSDIEREEAVAQAAETHARIIAALADLDPETLAPQEKPPTPEAEDDDWSDWSLRDHSDRR